MAAPSASTPSREIEIRNCLRLQMEDLLQGFYSAVGVAPRQHPPANAGELLADNFRGQFFLRDSGEHVSFNKEQMLVSDLGHRDIRPNAQLIALTSTCAADIFVSVNFAIAFRYGQTSVVRRGTFKAVKVHSGWALRSIDEEVRTVMLPESRRKLRTASDAPRVWIR
jgi:hypothetical protein